MTSGPVVPRGDGALVRLRVSPGARTTVLRGPYGDAAPPVDGRANAEVERFMAELTGAAPSGVRVVRGYKTVLVDGVGAERVREVLRSHPR